MRIGEENSLPARISRATDRGSQHGLQPPPGMKISPPPRGGVYFQSSLRPPAPVHCSARTSLRAHFRGDPPRRAGPPCHGSDARKRSWLHTRGLHTPWVYTPVLTDQWVPHPWVHTRGYTPVGLQTRAYGPVGYTPVGTHRWVHS